MTARDHNQDHDEEIRFAVILNGGVSLAIWMGGVTYEIDRLTRTAPGADSFYGRALGLVKARARADVIAGTSAGGINGAFLALAQVYPTADLSRLRDLWARRGGFAMLMRSPVRGPLSSLLKGDDYFLPELRKAFEAVLPPSLAGATPATERPVDLLLTTTIPVGQRRQFVDDLGQDIWEVEHTGCFIFSRTPAISDAHGAVDHFINPAIGAQLALAARSTASFPGAFEPSFVPVGMDGTDDLHPNMTGAVNFTASRYALDGGVLMNKPIRPALRAVWRKKPTTQVRRVLLYVNPDPGDVPAENAASKDKMPSLREVLMASVTRLTLQQSIHEDLEEIREANRQARDLRLTRPYLLHVMARPDEVHKTAEKLFALYQAIRAGQAARHVADIIGRRLEPHVDNEPDRLRGLLIEALRTRWPVGPEPIESATPYIRVDVTQPTIGPWTWGISSLERLAAFVRDLHRRAFWLLPKQHDECATLKGARAAAHDDLSRIDALRAEDDQFWAESAELWVQTLPPPPSQSSARLPHLDPEQIAAWVDDVLHKYRQALADKWTDASAIAQRLVRHLPVVARVARMEPSQLAPVSDRAREHSLIRTTVDALGIPGDQRVLQDPANLLQLLNTLLAFEVCLVATASETEPEREQTAELVLVSAHAPNRFAINSITAADKVAGLKLNHFGAFYKESWRVNDWIWGRVDGATRLMEALLEVDRLRQLGVTRQEIATALHHDTLPPDVRAEVAAELDQYESEGKLPGERRRLKRLHATALAFARQEQRQFVANELPSLATAVKADIREGANPRSHGARFLFAYKQGRAWPSHNEPGSTEEWALALFDDARIGAEPLEDEVGTDLFSRTASTAAANLVGTVDDKGSGLGRLRAITRPIRGLTLAVYALIISMSTGSRFGAALVNLALALGGALIAVDLLGAQQRWLTGVGATLILAGLLAAALRSRLSTLALLTGPPLLFLVLYLVYQAEVVEAERLGIVGVVVGIVLAGWLLSFAHEPARPPAWRHLAQALVALVILAALSGLFIGIGRALDGVHASHAAKDPIQVLAFLLSPDLSRSLQAREAVEAHWKELEQLDTGIGMLGMLLAVAALVWWMVRLVADRAFKQAPGVSAATPIVWRIPHQAVTAMWMPWYGLAFGLTAVGGYAAILMRDDVASWQPALALTALICWLLLTFIAPALLVWSALRARDRPEDVELPAEAAARGTAASGGDQPATVRTPDLHDATSPEAEVRR